MTTTKTNETQALRNLLVCNQMLSEKLLAANGIPVLVKHMSDPQDMETCALCAKICFVVATVPQEDVRAPFVKFKAFLPLLHSFTMRYLVFPPHTVFVRLGGSWFLATRWWSD